MCVIDAPKVGWVFEHFGLGDPTNELKTSLPLRSGSPIFAQFYALFEGGREGENIRIRRRLKDIPRARKTIFPDDDALA